MGCLNCNIELKHTPGKRKKQFCSPDCRVRYWQKNKPKKEPKSAKEIDRLEELLTWGPEIETFCAKKGFPPSELIEKYEGLEKELKDTKEFYKLPFSQNKPYDAPEMPKSIQDEPDFQKGKEGAENMGESDPGVMHWIKKAESESKEVGVKPASPKQMKESKPKELSPFLKSRQNLKNGMKQ